MRKRLCIFLIAWLPCFVMAAQSMLLQMTVSQAFAEASAAQVHMTHTQSADDEAMPCHHAAQEQPLKHNAESTAQHSCTVCGFCLMSAGMAAGHAFPEIHANAQSFAAPTYVHDPVHSLSFPPAIKPPIPA